MKIKSIFLATCIAIFSPFLVFASDGGHHAPSVFIPLSLLLGAALFGLGSSKIGIPSVVGQVLAGMFLGGLALCGVTFIAEIRDSPLFVGFTKIAVGLLLFKSGLESNVGEMQKVWKQGVKIALIGVFVPLVLVTAFMLAMKEEFLYSFAIGAAATATSVAITAKTFKDLGKNNTKSAKKILAAAVIDDLLGLILLAVVVKQSEGNSVDFMTILKPMISTAVLFGLAILAGEKTKGFTGRYFSRIDSSNGAKFTLAIFIACIGATVAHLMGLEEVIGTFAAGLVLDPVHFKKFKKPAFVEELESFANNLSSDKKSELLKIANHHSEKHIEDLIEGVERFFTPIFLVMVGLSVDLTVFANSQVLGIALGVSLLAVVGKVVSGFVAGNDTNKYVIGVAMVPRGEVGLIFASVVATVLRQNGLEAFSVIVIMVVITTLLGPILLKMLKNKIY